VILFADVESGGTPELTVTWQPALVGLHRGSYRPIVNKTTKWQLGYRVIEPALGSVVCAGARRPIPIFESRKSE